MLKKAAIHSILIVEDDPSMGTLLSDFLENAGYKIQLCVNGLEGLQVFQQHTFSICLVDVMMPEMDGFSMVQKLKEIHPRISVIFLTARGMKADKLKGFGLGADDYITKPFDEDELLCRIQSVLNRASYLVDPTASRGVTFGSYSYNPENQALYLNGVFVRRLTRKESDVLKLLCANRNKLLRREDILLNIWGENDYFHGRSLDVFIVRLRKYFKEDARIVIENVPSVGFIFNVLE